MRNVRRHDPNGAPVFLTIVCRGHRPLLRETRYKAVVRSILLDIHRSKRARIIAWVVLDDHLHLLLDRCDPDPAAVIGALKQQVLLALVQRSIWQARYFDHVIRDERDLQAHLDYVHFNPRKHGYVSDPADYEWSSMHHYVARNWYPAGWGVLELPSSIVEGTGSE